MLHSCPIVVANPHFATPLSRGVLQRLLRPPSPLFADGSRPRGDRRRRVATSPSSIHIRMHRCRRRSPACGIATLATPTLAPTLAAAMMGAFATPVEGRRPPPCRAAWRPGGFELSSPLVSASPFAASRLCHCSRGRTVAAVRWGGIPPLGRPHAKGHPPAATGSMLLQAAFPSLFDAPSGVSAAPPPTGAATADRCQPPFRRGKPSRGGACWPHAGPHLSSTPELTTERRVTGVIRPRPRRLTGFMRL